ncbi:MAG: hypothetical protein FWF77_02710 [Defluviitaleaceae bacterium]|nr:hypothetical protein [Defluviitaleaceae bacterium]
MKAVINKKTYDTDVDTKLGTKCVGAFGQADGYEEHLYVTSGGNHFFYGVGGPESPYAEPTINRALKKEAVAWKKENGIE